MREIYLRKTPFTNHFITRNNGITRQATIRKKRIDECMEHYLNFNIISENGFFNFLNYFHRLKLIFFIEN